MWITKWRPTPFSWHLLAIAWAIAIPIAGIIRPFPWTIILTVLSIIAWLNAAMCVAFGIREKNWLENHGL